MDCVIYRCRSFFASLFFFCCLASASTASSVELNPTIVRGKNGEERFVLPHNTSTFSNAVALTSVAGGLVFLMHNVVERFRGDGKVSPKHPLWRQRAKIIAASLLVVAGASYSILSRAKSIDYEVSLMGMNNFKPGGRVSVFLHGWGADCTQLWGEVNVGTLDEKSSVSFNFPEVESLCTGNLGQMPDALVTLHVLDKVNRSMNPESICLHGLSRGGGAAINALGILRDETEKYDQLLKKIGINKKARDELSDKIHRGGIELNVPLCHAGKAIDRVLPFLPGLLKRGAMYLFTRYRNDGLNADELAQTALFNEENVFCYFEKGDRMVGNKAEEANQRVVSAINKGVVIEGTDGGSLAGGHMHHYEGGKTFLTRLNEWREGRGIPTS